jgi:hypothetical protein
MRILSLLFTPLMFSCDLSAQELPDDERLPIHDNFPVKIVGDSIENGKVRVYNKAKDYLWYIVTMKNGLPVGQVVEYYPDEVIKMIAIYDPPGKPKDQIFFNADGTLMKLK